MNKPADAAGKARARAAKSLPAITRSSAAEYLTFVAPGAKAALRPCMRTKASG